MNDGTGDVTETRMQCSQVRHVGWFLCASIAGELQPARKHFSFFFLFQSDVFLNKLSLYCHCVCIFFQSPENCRT